MRRSLAYIVIGGLLIVGALLAWGYEYIFNHGWTR